MAESRFRATACIALSLWLCVSAQDPAATQDATTPAVTAPQPAPPTPAPSPAYEPVYHDLDAVSALVAGWLHATNVRVEEVHLPPTRAGRAVPALQWGVDGPTPLSDRVTIALFGGLDGVSLSGCEAVLSVAAAMIADPSALAADVTFLAVPWASPDALTAALAARGSDGRNTVAVDDDGDRVTDEDGPDDLDGDGLVLDLLIEDPQGPWTRCVDERFLARARPGDTPRYVWTREGKDDDRDGAFNEDAPGGVNLDLNFPIGWGAGESRASGGPNTVASGESLQQGAGELPLDDPTAHALADLLLTRRIAAALLFQGNHGQLAVPGGRSSVALVARADVAVFECAARLFAQSTARAQSVFVKLTDARGCERPGAAIDWMYSVPGALAVEVAAWGPVVEKAPELKGVALTDALFENGSASDGALHRAPVVMPQDLAWSRWLDNTRGGIGFVDWHPVELGDGRQGLVGGWGPLSRMNPPLASLPAALDGMSTFVTRLAASLPRLELRLGGVKRDGEVCTIEARLVNSGVLPTGLTTTHAAPTAPTEESLGATLEIALPEGARLIAGPRLVSVGQILPGATSVPATWVVLAAPGSVLTVRGSAPWTAPIVREVRP